MGQQLSSGRLPSLLSRAPPDRSPGRPMDGARDGPDADADADGSDVETKTTGCTKSSSIDRYMSALTDRMSLERGGDAGKSGKPGRSAARLLECVRDPSRKRWAPRFRKPVASAPPEVDVPSAAGDADCVCTLYRTLADDEPAPAFSISNLRLSITVYGQAGGRVYQSGVYESYANPSGVQILTDEAGSSASTRQPSDEVIFVPFTFPVSQHAPVIDIRWTAEQDCEERARIRRAWEIFEGVEPPPGFRPHIQMVQSNRELHTVVFQPPRPPAPQEPKLPPRIHTQVDFIHCLVPDLQAINNCSFYWGKMDRYEAERLLEGKPEGTFLLRDSAQEEYLFSVSFRKYGRSLHARIEQFNHKFSFDSHDPGVYAASTVTGLIEHYKDPACVMFFEPMLTAPLGRANTFPLQHLCRALIASSTTYDGINELPLPQSMKAYLKEYHYRQRVRVKRFRYQDEDAPLPPQRQ